MSNSTMLVPTDIEVDDTVQPRLDGLDETYVDELQESGPDTWPPIVVVERDGRYVLIDGRHRIEAARLLNCSEIACEIRATPEDGDLRGAAFEMNKAHGKPLTNADRKAEAKRLLYRDAQLSSREIARRCGIDHKTVEAIRAELEGTGEIPQSDTRTGADGKTRPATRSKKASRATSSSNGSGVADRSTDMSSVEPNQLATSVDEIIDYLDQRGWTNDNAISDLTDAVLAVHEGRRATSDLRKTAAMLEITSKAYQRAAERMEPTASAVEGREAT